MVWWGVMWNDWYVVCCSSTGREGCVGEGHSGKDWNWDARGVKGLERRGLGCAGVNGVIGERGDVGELLENGVNGVSGDMGEIGDSGQRVIGVIGGVSGSKTLVSTVAGGGSNGVSGSKTLVPPATVAGCAALNCSGGGGDLWR